MLCPFDATTLQVVNRSGVEIDWCPSCKGVWLERGELDKLIDLAAGPAPAPPAAAPAMPAPAPAPAQYAPPPQPYPEQRPPQYADQRPPQYAEPRRRDWDDDDDDWEDRQKYGDGYRSKKRKNLLSEIFDF